jgi:hypothetical protein
MADRQAYDEYLAGWHSEQARIKAQNDDLKAKGFDKVEVMSMRYDDCYLPLDYDEWTLDKKEGQALRELRAKEDAQRLQALQAARSTAAEFIASLPVEMTPSEYRAKMKEIGFRARPVPRGTVKLVLTAAGSQIAVSYVRVGSCTSL